MLKHHSSPPRLVAVSSLCIASLQTIFVYLFYIQSPLQSRREVLFTFIIFIGLLIFNYFLIKRFLYPKLIDYPNRERIGWFILSAFIGCLAVYTIPKTPLFIMLLPKHEVSVEIPAGNPDQSASLYWFSTSIGDIGFNQLKREGDWQQNELGLTHTGKNSASLIWRGRTGDSSELVFTSKNGPAQITVTVDGNPRLINLSDNPGLPVGVKTNHQVNLLNRLIAIIALWFMASYLFLVITLFLVHISIRISGNFRNRLKKVEQFISPTAKYLFNHQQNPWSKQDWIVVLFFFLLTVLFFLGRWNGLSPFIDLHGDAAYVSAYAASLDNPDAFAKDSLFNNQANFGYYSSLQVPLIRILTKFTGDYGFSYVILLIPYVFFQLAGFYFLGKTLFNSRFFSLLLSLVTIPLYYAQAGDYWGVWLDPQPRMMFQTILPWLLILVFFSIPRPRLRWMVICLLGLMIYIHPVSIPGIAFAIWLGYLVFKPSGLTWRGHLFNQFLFALIFLIFTFPFISQYMRSRDLSAVQAVDYPTARSFLEQLFPATFQIQATFINYINAGIISFLLPLAYFGSVFIFRHPSERQKLGLVLTWILGLLLITIGFNVLEGFIETKTHTLPVFLDLVRGLRYVIPLFQILVIWPLALGWNNSRRGSDFGILRRIGLAGIGIGIMLLFITSYPNTFLVQFPHFKIPGFHFRTLTCLKNSEFVCPSPELVDTISVLDFLRNHSQSGTSVISIPPVDMNGAVRFYANRPVAFDPGDLTRLAPGNISEAITLQNDVRTWSSIDNLPADQKLGNYIEFSTKRLADFLIIKNPIPDWLSPRIVFENSSFSVIDLR
jgi:hypothetical protein